MAGWSIALALVALPFSTAPAFADEPPAAAATGVTHAENPSVPVGAAWTEEYFPSSAPSNNGDPVELHADVLRPAHLAPGEKTPVIMSIGPYFSHSGMNADTHPAHTGPSARFTDLIEGAGLMARGYTFVYVDLRGFGGSTGCIEWLGDGEQADVVSAIEWAAQQPWSTGSVGLYGKSYDASTGLVGINHQVEGLEAVVAQEPAWSGYDYLITNNVSRTNQIDTPEAYLGIADLPGVDRAYQQDGYDIAPDTSRYLANASYETTHPECAQTITAETKEMDRQSAYWRTRDLPANVGGSTVPLMFTQGFTEQNTKPEGMQQYLSNHAGEERGWLGPWDHVRGNEVDAHGTLQMGRSTWFDEVMAFYDAHLTEHTTAISSSFSVQDNFGAWRQQGTWGTTDRTAVIPLNPGTYRDIGRGTQDDPGTPDPNPNPVLLDDEPGTDVPTTSDSTAGILTMSRPVATDVRLTGTPAVELNTQGTGNVAVELWDVAPDQSAVSINNSVARLSADGVTRFTLLGLDWTLAAGHRLGIAVDTINWGYWVPQPSGTEVTVTSASLSVAIEATTADVPTAGARAPFLDTYLGFATRGTPLPVVPETFTLSVSDAAPVPVDAGPDPASSSTRAQPATLAATGAATGAPAAGLSALAAGTGILILLGAAVVRRRRRAEG